MFSIAIITTEKYLTTKKIIENKNNLHGTRVILNQSSKTKDNYAYDNMLYGVECWSVDIKLHMIEREGGNECFIFIHIWHCSWHNSSKIQEFSFYWDQ